MNNKGFTLIELLATIIILVLVLSIGTYSVIHIINKAKEKNYNLLISNIKDAAEAYYQECKYANNPAIVCIYDDEEESYQTSLGGLITFGFLKGNATDHDGNYTLVNPRDNSDILPCMIRVSYKDNKLKIIGESGSSCPTEYNNDTL